MKRHELTADYIRKTYLSQIPILPRTITIETAKDVSASKLRGLWGSAIMRLDEDAYHTVFRLPEKKKGTTDTLDSAVKPNALHSPPAYVVAEGNDREKGDLLMLHWTLIGREAIARDKVLCDAWKCAAESGDVFKVRDLRLRCPRGHVLPAAFETTGWSLAEAALPLYEAAWSLAEPEENRPCQVYFPKGFHLVGSEGYLTVVTLENIVTAAHARIQHWLPTAELKRSFLALKKPLIEYEKPGFCSPSDYWDGTVDRAPNKKPPFYPVRGVSLRFPHGLGPLAPLFLAARWLQLGKHTSEGAGRMEFLELDAQAPTPKQGLPRHKRQAQKV